jgi:hypothetical protein
VGRAREYYLWSCAVWCAIEANLGRSRLHPLYQSGRRSRTQHERSSGRALRFTGRNEDDVQRRQPQVHALVQADLSLAAVRMVGASGCGVREIHEREAD